LPVSDTPDRYDPCNIDEILAQDWADVFPRVLKYAKERSRKYYWISDADINPEDLVNEAVARALGVGTGDTYRNWNKEVYPDFVDFLIGIIASMTNHEATHDCKFKNVPLLYEDGTENLKISKAIDHDPVLLNSREPGFVRPQTPEEELMHDQEYDRFVGQIKKALHGDEEAELILLCIEEDVCKPAHIAKETGYDIDKVYNAMRRIRSKMQKILPPGSKRG